MWPTMMYGDHGMKLDGKDWIRPPINRIPTPLDHLNPLIYFPKVC